MIFSLIYAKHFLIETEDNDESSDEIENNSAEEESSNSKVLTARGNLENSYFRFSCIHIFRNQSIAKCPAKKRVGVFL